MVHDDNAAVLLGDILRFINLVVGGGLLAVTAVIVWEYIGAYRAERSATADGYRGLLPRHVVLIGVSYLSIAGMCLRLTYGRIHEPLTWQGVVICAAFLMGTWALWDVLSFQREKRQRVGRAARRGNGPRLPGNPGPGEKPGTGESGPYLG